MASEEDVSRLSIDEAFHAANFMIDRYISLESTPDVGLVVFQQYMKSDPARWSDWLDAARLAVSGVDAEQGWLHD